MERFNVIVSEQAYADLEEIYCYIAFELQVPRIADQMLQQISDAVQTVETEPSRGVFRKTGIYNGKTHRQLFVKNYTIIYRVDVLHKKVNIVTIRYSKRKF